MKRKIKCAIYARYSSSNQKETSIEDQIRLCQEFADKREWKVLEEHIYIDKATSGTSIKNRKALQKLIKIIESGEAPFEYVLIEDTSRLARNIIDALKLATNFYFHNVKIYFVSQNIDTGNEAISEAFIAISGIIDDIFIKNLSQKTRRGMEGRFLAGFSTGGRIYGYRSIPVYGDKKDRYGNKEIIAYKIVIDQREAEVVREIFHLYSKGKSAQQIANILNERLKEHSEPKPPKGEWWSASTIRNLLKNKKYIGIWEWGKTFAIKNKDTGQIKRKKNDKSEWRTQSREELRIIDPELWEEAQNLLEKRRPKREHFSSAKSKYSKHLLTGILKCRNCGSSIVIVNSKKDKSFYGCSGRHNKGESVCKNSIKLDLKKLEKFFITEFKIFIENNIDKISEYICKIVNTTKSNEAKEKIKEEIRGIEILLNKLNDEDISSEIIRTEIKYLSEKREKLVKKLTSINDHESEKFISKKELKECLKNFLNKLENQEIEDLKVLLLDLISGIVIPEGRKWRIKCTIDIYELIERLLGRGSWCIKYETRTRFVQYTLPNLSFEFVVTQLTKKPLKARKAKAPSEQLSLFEITPIVSLRHSRKPRRKIPGKHRSYGTCNLKQNLLFDT